MCKLLLVTYVSKQPVVSIFKSEITLEKLYCWTLEDGTRMLSRTAFNQLPTYTAQHFKRAKVSAVPWRKLCISQYERRLMPKI